jgi:hypothetical protein
MACSAIVHGVIPKEDYLLKYLLIKDNTQKTRSSDNTTINQDMKVDVTDISELEVRISDIGYE